MERHKQGLEWFDIAVGIDVEKNEQYTLKVNTIMGSAGSDLYQRMLVSQHIYKDYKFDRIGEFVELGYCSDNDWSSKAIRILQRDGLVSIDTLWPTSMTKIKPLIGKEGGVINFSKEYASYTLEDFKSAKLTESYTKELGERVEKDRRIIKFSNIYVNSRLNTKQYYSAKVKTDGSTEVTSYELAISEDIPQRGYLPHNIFGDNDLKTNTVPIKLFHTTSLGSMGSYDNDNSVELTRVVIDDLIDNDKMDTLIKTLLAPFDLYDSEEAAIKAMK